MAFKQYKGDRMKSALPQNISDSDLDRYSSAHTDYSAGPLSTWDKKTGQFVDESNASRFSRIKKEHKLKASDIPKIMSLQKKWKAAHMAGGDRSIGENPTPEQRAQKAIEDDMYARAQKLGQHGPTDAVKAGQGVHYEQVSRGLDVGPGQKTHDEYIAQVEKSLHDRKYGNRIENWQG